MQTIDRYVLAIFVKNLLLGLTGLCALFLFQALLADVFDRNYTAQQVFIYHLLNVPKIAVQMAAPAVLLATVFTLSGLSRTNELIAIFAIGISLKRVILLLVGAVLILGSILLVMQDRVLPHAYRSREIYKYRVMQKRQDFFLDIKLDKIWYRSKNFIYNLQRFDAKTQLIYGMSMYEFDPKFNLKRVIEAKQAEYTPQGWKVTDGTITEFSLNDPFPRSQDFKEQLIKIDETPKDFQEIDKKIDGLRLRELYRYIQRMSAAGADTKAYLVQFHSRISTCLIPLVMCFLGVPFAVKTRREGGVAQDLGLCLLLTFFYWLFYSVGLSLGTNGALPPMLAAWLPSSIFGALAVALIARQNK
jgi:lipopolysaccharide export system permease protein